MRKPDPSGVLRLLAAGALAIIASVGLEWVNFPAAWLTGGLLGASVAVVCGIRFVLPDPAVNSAYIVLGALFGSTIRPNVIDQAVLWAGSLLVCCLSLAVIMYVSTWYMRRFENWDLKTSFFATAPGALPAVVALASEFKVDQRKVVLSQTVRLFSLMAFVPLIFSAPAADPQAPPNIVGALYLPELFYVLAIASLGGIALRVLRVPGALIIGALIATGIFYALGGVDGSLPVLLSNAAMMIIGILIGGQIARISVADFVGSMRAVAAALVIGVAFSAAAAIAVSEVTGLPLVQVLLAYLPGAMEGLTVLGFVLGLDPAYISLHHIARFLFVVLSLPLVSRYWRSDLSPKS